MKNKIFNYIFFLGLLFCMTIPCTMLYAHGTKYNIVKGGIGIKAIYSDNTPISHSDVRVTAPGSNSETSFQTGITDKNGVFIFHPDRPGIWQIFVEDGMGHGIKASISIDEKMDLEAGTKSGGLNPVQIALIIISLIWGAAGTALYFKKKQG